MGGDASALLLLGIMLHPCLSQDIQPTCCPDIIYTNGERTCCREITGRLRYSGTDGVDFGFPGREVLNNVTVQREISITLEATPSGKLCPSPNLQDPEGNSPGSKLLSCLFSSTAGCGTIYFVVVASGRGTDFGCIQATSNVPYDKEECPDCCLPNFASETMSCSSSDSPVSTRGQQCAGYLDSSCSVLRCFLGKPGTDRLAQLQGAAGIFSGKCVGQACSRYKFLLSWNLFESFQIRILAPATFMYTWKPTTSGILVLHYRVLLGPDRFACCPYGMDTCCPSSTGASLGYVSTRLCNGPSSCNDGSTCSGSYMIPDYAHKCSRFDRARRRRFMLHVRAIPEFCGSFTVQVISLNFLFFQGFGEGLKTLSDIQKIFAGQDVNTRSNIPGRHEVKVLNKAWDFGLTTPQLTSEGLVLDVELASPVTAGQTYTLEGVTFNAQSSCEACLAFGFNGLVCEWNPMSRQCVQKGTSSMLINITQCAASLPPLIGSKVAAKSFGPIIASFFIILTLVVAYVYNKSTVRFANKQTAVIERESNLVQHAEMYEQQRSGHLESLRSIFSILPRHWDPRLVHPRPLVRGPKGEIDYQSEVMEKRLQNPKTPYHLMDADTVAKHHEMHGYVTETQLLS
eukprot:343535-Hanusia_phi.AAC.4